MDVMHTMDIRWQCDLAWPSMGRHTPSRVSFDQFRAPQMHRSDTKGDGSHYYFDGKIIEISDLEWNRKLQSMNEYIQHRSQPNTIQTHNIAYDTLTPRTDQLRHAHTVIAHG